jgi:hypothetical protein
MCIAIISAAIAIPTYYLMAFNSSPMPFSLDIIKRPASFGDITYAVVGQKCIFLIVVDDEGQTNGNKKAVSISASSSDCQVTVLPKSIIDGQVAEVSVIPVETNIGKNITITIKGEREGLIKTKTIMAEIIEGENTLGPEAAAIRDKFIPWLSTNHPELGIVNETEWVGTIVNPRILVVMHYIFLSEDWEMYVTWHVMIPPYDWAKIYLRHRFNETSPSYAFEISSIQEKIQPQPIEVPDWVQSHTKLESVV